MADSPFFHVGILVADIDAAIDKFSRVFDLSFPAPRALPIRFEPAVSGEAEAYETEARATFSREGPPHIELVQGGGDAYFSLAHGEGLHHLGLWAPSWGDFEALEPAKCLPVMTKIHMMPGEPQMWTSDPADLCGTRVEYVDEATRPMFDDWIAGH